MLEFPASKPPSQAARLIEVWNRVSRQHMSAGSGCGCGFGGLILQAADFELDIVEFVIDAARNGGHADLLLLIDAVSKRGPDRYSIKALLDALNASDIRISEENRSFALTQLAKTLNAIDKSHSKGRFACD